ncbi:hypothetical protein CBOM_04979 [Ceraceosorus bombacis]|uniref:Uncharacterized protein n=1 Tax=Ceraceosorus bombacis TaxID=401625 RepID=A0A0P1BI73_9BASI|nr:hypothetical protein CBOM_04979 [Ceraceosorus bombacis]
MSVALGKSLDAGGGPSSAAHTRSVQRKNSETLAALHSARSISFPDATPSALLAASNRRSQSTLMGPSTSSGIGNILEPGANSLVSTSAASRMQLRLATSSSSPARTRSKSVPATPKGLAAPDQRNKLLSFLPGVLPDGRLSAAEIPPRTSSHFYEPFFAPFEGKETTPPLWRRERPISGAGGSGRISALSHIWSSGDWFTTQQLLEGIEMDRRDYGENAPDLRSYSTLFAAQTRAEMLHHLEALDALQPRLPADIKALRPLRLRSTLAQVHHRLALLVSYAHVPATIFLDYNAIYTLVQLAIFPSTPGTAVAWWVAAGVYAAFTIFWLAGIVVIWEGLVAYRRVWTEPRPAVLPIYLSSAVFTLSSIRSFSLYSLLYRVRCSARPVDAALETMWYYRQNWPTVATLAPRAIICAVVLALYHPFSPFAALNGRDSTYLSQERDELTSFAYVVLIINASWAAWRLLLVLASATLLFVELIAGPGCWPSQREMWRMAGEAELKIGFAIHYWNLV